MSSFVPDCPGEQLVFAQKCWTCLRRLPPERLACPRCALARYCSRRCRARHAVVHAAGHECGVPWPALLPARAVLAARLARFIAAVRGGEALPTLNLASATVILTSSTLS